MKNKGCLVAVLWVFSALGALAAYFIGGLCLDALRPYEWEQVKGEIVVDEGRLDQTVSDFSPPFTYRIRYRYPYRGQTHESEESGVTRDWLEIAARQKKFPPGGQTVVYVNPADPKQNYLELPSLWVFLWLLFPLPFFALPVLFFYTSRRAAAAPSQPRKPATLSGRALVILYCCLTLIGGGIFFGAILEPAVRAARVWRWQQADCTIDFSRVGAHRGSKGGVTYSIDVLFSYRVSGVNHKSSRYELETASSGGSEDKQAVVDRLKPGARTVCYYDPDRPEWAVLDRSFPSLLFLGLFPLFLFLVGAVALLRRLARAMRPPSPPAGVMPGLEGPKPLEAATSKLGRFAGCLGICLFWNSLTGIAVTHVVRTWLRGDGDVTLTLVVIPFAAVGLVTLGGVFYYFLGLFTPRPRITLSPPAVRLGGSTMVEWRLKGLTAMVRRLRVTVEAAEIVTSGTGKSRTTEKEIFRRIEVLDTRDSIREGTARLPIPRDTMHSIEGEDFKIIWEIKVHGEIRFWADVEETYAIEVLPGSARSWETER
jgi:hypothetical protein